MVPSIFEMCFSTFLAQPMQCIETLNSTVCQVQNNKLKKSIYFSEQFDPMYKSEIEKKTQLIFFPTILSNNSLIIHQQKIDIDILLKKRNPKA